MFEDEDDILVCFQGPDCSLRSADYEIPGCVPRDVARLLWATREVHGGSIVHGAQSLLQ